MSVEELYSNIPPTKLRNQDEEFKPAKTTPFWLWVANQFFYKMLENRFFALRYKGENNFFDRDENIPTIAFAPHTNWWDGIVAYNITRRIFDKEIRLMVEELNRFPLLRRGGAFPINKKSPQASMTALKYSIDVIGDLENVLYIFPQGIIKPPNYRPIEFQTGLAYIAQKAAKKYGKVNLVPVGVNYFFLRADKPEVMVEIGNVITLENEKTDRKEFSEYLAEILEQTCDKQNSDIAEGNLTGYKTLFQQKLKWYRKIEQRLKKIEIKGSGV
ncbi:MAG: lysophospholipid acyltransferase family protein [Candidatus Gastranaerophilaceae bacterium]